MVITIDGPAGAGKSTVAQGVARALHYQLIDTGAIYRAFAFHCAERGIHLPSDPRLAKALLEFTVGFTGNAAEQRVYLDQRDITDSIRQPDISQAASLLATSDIVRQGLLSVQRELAANGNAIFEGRDTGTVVWPQAELKIFLTASEEVRAQRRYHEFTQKGIETSLARVLEQQRQRDKQDTERTHAPLRPADDAIWIDSSAMTLAEVVQSVVDAAQKKAARS